MRLEDAREDWKEENCRSTCWQGRIEEVAGDEANLYMVLADDVNGMKIR